jgi:tetratricopeptide (TPR) repeat protein
MPQRPREHQLETESRLAFHAALPSAWVLRNLTDDYGIDAEVELFDAKGFATGAKFLVQLKATDETNETRALRVSVSRETGRYYDSLRLPILIVRYVASRKQLYARWFHAFDSPSDTKSLVLRLAVGDVWTPETPSMLEACVAAYRQLREPVLNGDVTFLLDLPSFVHGIPRYEVTSSLQEAAEEIRRVHFRAARTAEYGPNRVRVTNEVIEVVLAEAKRFVLATGAGYLAEEERESLHHDILTGVGLALATFGHHTAASWILSRHAIHSNLLTIRSVALQLGPALAEAHHFASLIEIADELLRRSQIDEAAVYLLTFYTWHVRLSPAERTLAVEFVARMAARLLDRGDVGNAAKAHYNCAVLLRKSGAFREAVREYRRAAEVDPEYLTRAYWWAELAGILFVSGRFAMSAQLYERAYELDPSNLYGRNYADALLFRGSYRQAAQLLDKHLVEVTEEESEWVLKSIALQYVRDFTRREEQRRRPGDALDLFIGVSSATDVPERLCRDALQLDALSGIAWFNLANGFLHQGKHEDALSAYLAAAVTTPADVEAWANVIALAQRLNDPILSALVHYATAKNQRQRFVREYPKHIDDPVAAEEAADRISELVESLPVDRSVTYRWQRFGGSVETADDDPENGE